MVKKTKWANGNLFDCDSQKRTGNMKQNDLPEEHDNSSVEISYNVEKKV